MDSIFNRKNILILIIVVLNIACDQISKDIVRSKINYNDQITVINKFITLTKVENTGAFLSLGNNISRTAYKIIMIFIPLIVLGYAVWLVQANKNLTVSYTVGISLIVGGGLGNIIDRILYGSVTDFLYFDFQLFHTGIVNLADIFLTSGFFILIFELLVNQVIRKRKAP